MTIMGHELLRILLWTALLFFSHTIACFVRAETCNESDMEKENDYFKTAKEAYASVYGGRCANDYYNGEKSDENRVCAYDAVSATKYMITVNACALVSYDDGSEAVSNFTAACRKSGGNYCSMTGSMTGVEVSKKTSGTAFELNYKCFPKCFPTTCTSQELEEKVVQAQKDMLNPDENTNLTKLVYSADLDCGDETQIRLSSLSAAAFSGTKPLRTLGRSLLLGAVGVTSMIFMITSAL